MKKLLLLISFFVICLQVNAQNLGYINFAYLYEMDGSQNQRYFSIGQDLITENEFFYYSKNYFVNIFGFNYKFGNDNHILNTQYILSFFLGEMDSMFFFFFTFGGGINASYNISKNIFGIAPQLDFNSIIIFIYFKLNVYYRYNIYFGSRNSHEIGIRIGVIDLVY